MTNRKWLAFWTAIGVAIIWHCWSASFNHDEIEHLHAAWLISIGQLPFRDFLEQHHPTLWFLAAPLVARFESVRSLVFAVRLFNAVSLVAVLWLVKRILRRLYPDVRWQFAVLLLLASFMFVRNSIEFRPDPAMNVALYAGLLNWLALLQEGRMRRALAAGICFGAAMVVLQKAAVIVALIAITVPILMLGRRRRREPIGRVALAAATSIAASLVLVAVLFGAMRALGIFQDFWFWNYPFNRFFYMQAHLPEQFSLPSAIGRNFLVDPLLWLAGAIGAWLCLRELWAGWPFAARDECRFTLLSACLGYLGFLCFNRFPLDQYLIVVLPLLALFGAESLRAAQRARLLLERSILAMPLVLLVLLLVYPTNEEQLRVQGFVLRRTSLDQPVFAPPAFNPVFRRDAAYFWYNGGLISGAYEQYCSWARACQNDKLALDEKRWASSPPTLVFLEAPPEYPYHWSSRSSSYHPSRLPGLWEREERNWGSQTASRAASSEPIAAGARRPP